MTTEENGRFHRQEVNYLGFLEAKLRDLRGMATMVYELVQNADDARNDAGKPAARRICFDVRDEMLIIENDGVFRDVDFARLQQVASGGKRDEAGTVGAFGIGFIAVYHITDSPEIVSNGRSWTIRPQEPAAKRILEQSIAQTSGTQFRLPWAFDATSPVRQRLRLEAVDAAELDNIANEIARALESAALFLQQLELLEVSRNGELVCRIERSRQQNDRLLLTKKTATRASETVFYLLHGQFYKQANSLCRQFPQIEKQRRAEVTIALPTDDLENGYLYAGLPTETAVWLSLHLNGDFYPTTDRRRIIWGSDYQATWNQAILNCAARTLAEQLPRLPQYLGGPKLWHLLQQSYDLHQPDTPFAIFWKMLAPRLKEQTIVFRSDEQWAMLHEARIWPSRAEQNGIALLQKLDLTLVHPALQPYFPLMETIGVPLLQWQQLASALTKTTILPSLSLSQWRRLWAVLDVMLLRTDNKLAAEEAMLLLPIGLDEAGEPTQPRQLVRGDGTTQQLFPKNKWLHEAVPPHSILWRLVPHFDIAYAVDYLAQFDQEWLETAWYRGELDLEKLFRWFEMHQMEVLSNPPLREKLRRLPLGPAGGALHPLHYLMLPGGFHDPLQRAFTIDLTAVGERALFFLQDLGLKRLTFDSYLREQLPRILTRPTDLRSDNMHQLIRLLAERLGEFQDDNELQAQLAQLPLVATMDGHFRPASETYATRAVYDLLNGGVYVAEPVTSRGVEALHHWLGVATTARRHDIVERANQLVAYVRNKSKAGVPLDETAYGYLNDLAEPMIWEKLYDEAVIHVGNGRYIQPRRAYWRPHAYGRFRYHLDARLRNYANLFTFLGVREKPVAIDAIDVLLDIGAEMEKRPLSPEDAAVIHDCWQTLDGAWQQSLVPVSDLERLTTQLVILGEQNVLQKPLHLFFDDQPTISAQFPILAGQLLPPPPESLAVYQVAGVRRISQQSWLHLLEAPEGTADSFLTERFAERQALLYRVAAAEGTLAMMEQLLPHFNFVRAERLVTQVSLEAFGRVHHAEPETKTAVFIPQDNIFYIAYGKNSPLPWTAIANELARLVKQKPPFTMMALGIKEVLSSETAVSARQTLDELGYPEL